MASLSTSLLIGNKEFREWNRFLTASLGTHECACRKETHLKLTMLLSAKSQLPKLCSRLESRSLNEVAVNKILVGHVHKAELTKQKLVPINSEQGSGIQYIADCLLALVSPISGKAAFHSSVVQNTTTRNKSIPLHCHNTLLCL